MFEIPPGLYSLLYHHLIIVIIIFYVIRLNTNNIDSKTGQHGKTIILTLFLLLFIGLRPINVPGVGKYFGDTINYYKTFSFIASGGLSNTWADPVFEVFTKWCAKNILAQTYFFLLALLYIVPIYFACIRINLNHSYLLLLMIVSSMLFWSNGVNGIRAGIGSSLLLLGFSYNKDKRWLQIILFSLAIGFHKSMILPVGAYLISSVYSNYKVYTTLWFCSIALSLIFGGFWENFFAAFTLGDERFTTYLTTAVDVTAFKHIGFRWDFLIYSALTIIAAYLYLNKLHYLESKYIHLLNTYLITNSFWVLIIRSNFSNRFAALSWFLIPLILIMPLTEEQHFNKNKGLISICMILSYAFTYYMSYSTIWG